MTQNRSEAGEPLRVLFAITDLGKGGAERFLLDLCHALRRRGDVEFLIATLREIEGYTSLSAGLPIVPLEYQTFSLSQPPDNPRWARILDEFAPHIVHTHRFLAEFLSGQHVKSGIGYVCHGHDNMIQLDRFGPKTLVDRARLLNWIERRWLIRHKYRHVRTAFIANSEHTLRYYRRVLPPSMASDVHLIQYGFDFSKFRASAARSVRAGKPIRLINVGSFVDKKNQQLAIRVLADLAARGIDATLELLGDGVNRDRLSSLANSLGVLTRVFFRGNVDRVEDHLASSDVYLHTATYEPFGLVLLEAMAAGLPCVVRDGLGNRDLIVEGRNGFLLETDKPALYADRVLSTTRDANLYHAMSAFAIAFASRFHIDTAATAFVDFYRTRLVSPTLTAGS